MSGGIIGKVSESNNTHLISNTFYAVCETASNTTPKIAKLVDSSINSVTLIEGMFLTVKFLYENTDSVNIVSLKIQSSAGVDLTGSVRIKKYSIASGGGAGIWSDNSIVTFVYDGSFWVQTQAYAEQDGNDKVMQGRVSSADNEYEVLLAYSAGTTVLSETEPVNKSANLLFNPSTNNLTVGGTVVVGSAPTANMQVATKKYVDDSISSAGGGTVLGVTAGTGLQVGDGTGSQTISTTGTLNHSNVAHQMSLRDSEYDDARIWAFLFDNNGHIRKYKPIGIDPTEVGNVTVDGVYGANIERWAQCRTAADVAAKTATMENGIIYDDFLLTGTRVTVNFLNGSNAENPTLNINNTGAYDIYYNGSQMTGLILPEEYTVDFVFDGSYWVLINYDYSSTIDDLWDAMPSVTNIYTSTGLDAVNGIAVNAALQTLDSSVTATTGQAISAITITDGKISGSTKIDVGAPKATWYGTCSTTASTAEKAVVCSDFDFTSGAIIGILFSTANTAATPTLNVNSKGAKSIYVGASTPSSTTNVLKWSANTMIYFMYDGTYFRYITSVSAGSVIPSRGANTWYGTSSTGATTQAKTSTIDNFVLTKGAIVVINFSTANTYTSAKITLNINSTGAKDIYYKNAVTSSTNTLLWDANTALTFIYDGTGYQFVGRNKAKYSTTSVGSASGWNAGSTPSLGTAISADDITGWTTNTPTAIDTSKFNGGSFTQGTDSFTAATLTMSGGGSTASAASTLTISFSGGSFTQGTDSHTAASLSSGFYTAGTAASLSYDSKSIPNVTSVGTAPSLTVTSTTVVDSITSS